MMRTFAVILLLAIGAAAETGSEDKEVRLRGAYSTAHHFSSKYRSSSARRRLCGLPCLAVVRGSVSVRQERFTASAFWPGKTCNPCR